VRTDCNYGILEMDSRALEIDSQGLEIEYIHDGMELHCKRETVES